MTFLCLLFMYDASALAQGAAWPVTNFLDAFANDESCGGLVVSVTSGLTDFMSVESVTRNDMTANSVVYTLPPIRTAGNFDPRTPLRAHLQQVDTLGFQPV